MIKLDDDFLDPVGGRFGFHVGTLRNLTATFTFCEDTVDGEVFIADICGDDTLCFILFFSYEKKGL